jgi:hypothetical protein
MIKGSTLKGALATRPRGGRVTSLPVGAPPKSTLGLQRMSPGVYRNPQGQLVNSKGGELPGQRQKRPQPQQIPQRPSMTVPNQQMITDAIAGVGAGAGSAFGNKPYQKQPGMIYAGGNPNFDERTGQYRPQQPMQRMPFPMQQPNQDGMMYMGGSPNFNETTGQYNPELSAITQASQAAQQQMGQPQYNPQMQFAGGFGAPQMSPNQQSFMPGNPNYGEQFNAQQQAFNQQQAMGNSLPRMMPSGRMV